MGYDERHRPADRPEPDATVTSRRDLLGLAAASGLALAAGCLDGGGTGGGADTTPTTGDQGGGPYGDDDGTDSPTPTGSPTATPSPTDGGMGTAKTTVRMVNTAFDPVRASVDPGTTVEWVNEDAFQHDVTAAQFHDAAASWDFSKTLSGGQSASYTFESAGVYEYYCTIHGKDNMCGAVIVGEANLNEDLPCEGGGY